MIYGIGIRVPHVKGKAKKYAYRNVALYGSYQCKNGNVIWKLIKSVAKDRRGYDILLKDVELALMKFSNTIDLVEEYGSFKGWRSPHNKKLSIQHLEILNKDEFSETKYFK